MTSPGVAEDELEKFRRQWQKEVSARNANPTYLKDPRSDYPTSPVLDKAHPKGKPTVSTAQIPPVASHAALPTDQSSGYVYHDLPDKEDSLKLEVSTKERQRHTVPDEPQTALEHYEKAVEQETAGRLGDSLRLYRQAFKLDDNVHERYKQKHFAASTFPPKRPITVPDTATKAPAPTQQTTQSTIAELIRDFSALSIPGAPPPTDASPRPPCLIAGLPSEIIVTILRHVAIKNVANFSHLALVCKRLAYLIMTEEQIWKVVVLSNKQGFGNMHYKYVCDVFGKTLEDDRLLTQDEEHGLDEMTETTPLPSLHDISSHLCSSQYANSWRHMFRSRPRIRFHGVYISTVNYSRPGAASATINTWATPVHVVTYYRYLRFYRDGTVVSLLTTAEPIDVVHVISKDHLPEQTTDPRQQRRNNYLDKAQASRPPPTSLSTGGSGHGHGHGQAQAQTTDPSHALPSSQIMKDALRGRWRLSGPGDGTSPGQLAEVEGDLHIETEGVVPKYMYKMHFSLGSSSTGTAANAAAQTGQNVGGKRGSRNNRLAWKGFWSYNRLTDDWGEFSLRNDRAYLFSRVKSYGNGG